MVNDTIQFLGCYQGDDFVEQNWVSPTGKAIRLEYFFLDSLVFLEFDWFDKGELQKSITVDADFIEDYSYEPNLIRYAKYNREGGLRVQGGYTLVDITPPDTSYSFNPFAWEEMVEVRRKREEKTGLWIYFGSGGEAIKQEKY